MSSVATFVFFSFVLVIVPSKSFGQHLTDSEIRDTLFGYNSTAVQREHLLHGFGLETEKAKIYAFDDNDTNPNKIEWLALRQASGAQTRALFFPCRDYMYGARVLLLTEVKGAWKMQSEEGFDCHYDFNVSIQVVSLTSSNHDDLLIRHVCIGHGTGYVEQEAELFSITNNKLQRVWRENDLLKAFGWPETASGELNTSTFLATTPGTLEETRESRKIDGDGEPLNSVVHVERRTFHWSAEKQTLLPSPFRRLR